MKKQACVSKEVLTISYLHSYHIFYDLIASYVQNELKVDKVGLLGCESLESLLKAVSQHKVDIVLIHSNNLLDGQCQHGEIRKALTSLTEEENVRTIFIAENLKSIVLKKIIALGIDAIISTRDKPQELMAAITGEHPDVECYLSQNIKEEVKESCRALTEKEWEVVSLIHQGYSLTEIASKKFRAMSTVSTQKRNAMNKLHLKNEGELLRFLHQNTIF